MNFNAYFKLPNYMFILWDEAVFGLFIQHF